MKHAYAVCFNVNFLQKELQHIERCFTEINCYPKWLLKQSFDSFKINNKNYNTSINNKNNNSSNINNLSDKIIYTLKLAYKGNHGINVIKSIKTSAKNTFPEKHDVRIIIFFCNNFFSF